MLRPASGTIQCIAGLIVHAYHHMPVQRRRLKPSNDSCERAPIGSKTPANRAGYSLASQLMRSTFFRKRVSQYMVRKKAIVEPMT
jgi:hypothetical protein